MNIDAPGNKSTQQEQDKVLGYHVVGVESKIVNNACFIPDAIPRPPSV